MSQQVEFIHEHNNLIIFFSPTFVGFYRVLLSPKEVYKTNLDTPMLLGDLENRAARLFVLKTRWVVVRNCSIRVTAFWKYSSWKRARGCWKRARIGVPFRAVLYLAARLELLRKMQVHWVGQCACGPHTHVSLINQNY